MGSVARYVGTKDELDYILSRLVRGYRRLAARNLGQCHQKVMNRLKDRIMKIGKITENFLMDHNDFR